MRFRHDAKPVSGLPIRIRHGAKPAPGLPVLLRHGAKPVSGLPMRIRHDAKPVAGLPDRILHGAKSISAIPHRKKHAAKPASERGPMLPTYDSGDAYDSGLCYTDDPVVPVITTQTLKGRKYMAGNPVSEIDNEALAMAEDLADGLHLLEVPLGVTGVTEVKTRAAITLCHTADKDVGDAKKARQAASTALQLVDETAMEYISATRKVLAGFLTEHWSAAWEPTGFPDQSTAVPRTQEKRLNLCRSLKEYFTANPTQEVAALGVTAALANTNYTALSDGRELLAEKETDQGVKLKARDATYAALRKLLRTAVTELRRFLADDDDRWHTFNLNAPADPVTPDAVESVTLTPGTLGVILASWDRARRASRYRPFVQIVGVDTEFKARDAVHDLTVNLSGFTTGKTVKVYLVAANDDGEAPASPTEQIVVP